ncbi:MAG: hypothetical protein GC184_06305 [Rhizobiales bacterium]|nr:hypothetical protein [Hyphomicrobiales bacterium]
MIVYERKSLTDAECRQTETRLAWWARLVFALCYATIFFMAVHGDENGRRPRFVLTDVETEDAIKSAVLETDKHKKTAEGTVSNSPTSAVVSVSGAAHRRAGVTNASALWISSLREAKAYVLPFSIGPPQAA